MKSRALLLLVLLGCGKTVEAPPPSKILEIPKQEAIKTDKSEFKTQDGRIGWKVAVPGGRPLATPAYKDDLVLVGGGFGSHEFYAFDAKTGKQVWVYKTGDDGPTAAVVEGDYVVFNTESCEVEVLEVKTGKPVWKKWLGDPLMSMPAIDGGKIYMAFPDSKGDRNHYLICLDLKDGKEYWRQKITGEVITAPVIDKGQVYASCVDGTMFCFKNGDGALVFSEKKNATSSPCVFQGQLVCSYRKEAALPKGGIAQEEMLAYRGVQANDMCKAVGATRQSADYLDESKKRDLVSEKQKEKADEGVGFGGGGKGDSKMHQAEANIGEKTVSGVWAYQGSRPFMSGSNVYTAMGDNVKCLDKEGNVLWERQMKKGDAPVAERSLTPPAIVNGKMFFGTVQGDVLCLNAKNGDLLWSVNVGEPIVFQPSVMNGRVYVGTSQGSLFGIETGDSKDTGWAMWGATPRHNGLE